MKAWSGVLVPIVVLSLAGWAFFYVLTPSAPLTPAETLVVVGACAALVFLGRWVWCSLRKPRRDNGPGS